MNSSWYTVVPSSLQEYYNGPQKVVEALLENIMTLFNTKPLILFHLHQIFILWKLWLPISMSCRYCGLCSLKGRTINIILGGREEMLPSRSPRDSKIELCQVSQNLSLVGINRSLTGCMLRKVLWVICNKLESGKHQEGLSIVPICFTLQHMWMGHTL